MILINCNDQIRDTIKDNIPKDSKMVIKQSNPPYFYYDCHPYFIESNYNLPTKYFGSFFSITDSGWFPDSNELVASLPALWVRTFFPPGWLSAIFVRLYTLSLITTQRLWEWSCYATYDHNIPDDFLS